MADFGLSRRVTSGSTTITATNRGMGSIYHAAPEQWKDLPAVDERADVFALGTILYELLTGELPWPSLDATKVPAKYRWPVIRATEDSRDKRYPSVAAMAAEFELFATDSSTLTVPMEQAKQLLPRVAAGDTATVGELDQLLVTNQDD